jgi:hypothetical protein
MFNIRKLELYKFLSKVIIYFVKNCYVLYCNLFMLVYKNITLIH